MSDKKRIIGTREKKKEFAILPPQLQRIIYLIKYLSVFIFLDFPLPCFRACTTIFVAISASVRLFGKRLFAGKPIEDRYIIGTVRRDILTAMRHYGWPSAYRIRLYYTSRLMHSFAILLSTAGLSFALF